MEERSVARQAGDAYELQFESRPGYLYARYAGPAESLEATIKTWLAIADQCRARNYTRVLVVEDLGTQLSDLDKFTFATELPTLGFRHIKVAFVDCWPDEDGGNRFSENMLINRGVVARVFSSVTKAERWLLSNRQ